MEQQAFKELLAVYSEDVAKYKQGEGLTERLYESLFSYYCSTGEMPYGVAKARTGDPYDWIEECFGSFILSQV
jgi:hypothetical protein